MTADAKLFENLIKERLRKDLGLELFPIDMEREQDDIAVRESNAYFYSRTGGMEIFPPDANHPYVHCKLDAIKVRKERYNIPADADPASQLYVGLYDINGKYGAANRCIAILDMLRGYPGERSIYLGWIMLHAEIHHKGLGTKIMDAIYSCGREAGYEEVRLAAYAVNEIAINFWRGRGYALRGITPMRTGAGILALYKLIKPLK